MQPSAEELDSCVFNQLTRNLHARRNSAFANVLISAWTHGIIPHPGTVWFSHNWIRIDEETFSKSVPVFVTLPGKPGQKGDEVSIGRTSSIPLSQHTCQKRGNILLWLKADYTLWGHIDGSVPISLSGILVKKTLSYSSVLIVWFFLPPMCWRRVWGRNFLSESRSMSYLCYLLDL